MNSQDLLRRIERRYSREQGWFVLGEMSDRSVRGRRCDAFAMQLWESRGFKRVGLEIKVSRPDWLAELKQPEKAENGLWPYCHEWYLVVSDPSIIQDGEVPAGWGLLVPHSRGLKALAKAQVREPKLMNQYLCAHVIARMDKGAEEIAQRRAKTLIEERAKADGESAEARLKKIKDQEKELLDLRSQVNILAIWGITMKHGQILIQGEPLSQGTERLLRALSGEDKEGPLDTSQWLRREIERLEQRGNKFQERIRHDVRILQDAIQRIGAQIGEGTARGFTKESS